MGLLEYHERALREYCQKNGYSFQKLRSLPRCGNEKVLFIQVLPEESSGRGLRDDTPAEILLTLEIRDESKVVFTKGKNADKYLKE